MIDNKEIERLKQGFLKALSDNKAVCCKGKALEKKIDLLVSSVVEPGYFHDTAYIMKWLKKKRAVREMSAREIAIKNTRDWIVDQKTGNIHHITGNFFSIVGMEAASKHREIENWCQPILKCQPEAGILGILAKKFDGVIHFLMQAKDEPGNIGGVQISPTLQATKSNYSRVHKGKLPLFFDYFFNVDKSRRKILYKKLQSEEGGRFLKKNNLNIVIELGEDEDIDVPDNFIWMTLCQVKALMEHEDIVNSCARSIIACLP